MQNKKDKNILKKRKIYNIIIAKKKLEKIRAQRKAKKKIKQERLRVENLRIENLRVEKLKEEKLKKKWKRLIKSFLKDDDFIIKEIFFYYKKYIERIELSDDNSNQDNNLDKKLWNFWFPIFNINDIEYEEEKIEDIPWIIYICIKSNMTLDRIINSYYKLFKRDHIYKIIIKNEPLMIDYSNKYSTHMIVYSKRMLEYYDIITNDLSNFDQYKYVDFNILNNNNKYSKIKKDIKCILHDIRLQLELGLYDDYVIYNYNMLNKKILMKHSLGPRIINKKIIKMLTLNKLNIRFISLRLNEILYDYLV